MEKARKKQFSLSLLVKIFLVLLVVISLGVFATSAMYYNQLEKEVAVLSDSLERLYRTRAELVEMLGSAERLNDLLSDYEKYRNLLENGSAEGELLDEYSARMEEIRNLLHSSQNFDYISKIAKEELNLYFADEKIFYNDMN